VSAVQSEKPINRRAPVVGDAEPLKVRLTKVCADWSTPAFAIGAWFVPFRESRANLAKLKAQERALRAATAINQLARILPVVTTGP